MICYDDTILGCLKIDAHGCPKNPCLNGKLEVWGTPILRHPEITNVHDEETGPPNQIYHIHACSAEEVTHEQRLQYIMGCNDVYGMLQWQCSIVNILYIILIHGAGVYIFWHLFGKRGHCKGPNQMNFRRGGYQPTNLCPSIFHK